MACSQPLELCLYFAAFVFLTVVKKLHFALPLVELLLHVPAKGHRKVGILLDHTHKHMRSWKRANTSTSFLLFVSSGNFVSLVVRGQYYRNWAVAMDEEWCRLSRTIARTGPCILGFYFSYKGGCNRRDIIAVPLSKSKPLMATPQPGQFPSFPPGQPRNNSSLCPFAWVPSVQLVWW